MPFSKNICSTVDKLFQKNKITFDLFNFLSLKNIFSLYNLGFIFATAILQGYQNVQIYLYFPPTWSLAYTGQLNSQTLTVYFIFGNIVSSVGALTVSVFITWPWMFNSYWVAFLGIWPLQLWPSLENKRSVRYNCLSFLII